MQYEIVKVRSAHLVREIATGELIQTRTKREAQEWIARQQRNAEKDAWWIEREREARIENVRAYLARRAARPVSQQLSFF